MKALQRLNTAYFLSGYLGFTATWMLGLIARILNKQALSQATAHLKSLLRCVSPHYCFAQGLYDITNTYKGSGGVVDDGTAAQRRRTLLCLALLCCVSAWLPCSAPRRHSHHARLP
jgi:hypothetical protein